MPPISGAWAKALEGEFHKPYYKKLFETVGKNMQPIRFFRREMIFLMRFILHRWIR